MIFVFKNKDGYEFSVKSQKEARKIANNKKKNGIDKNYTVTIILEQDQPLNVIWNI